jgi:hypothetical protein
MPNRSSKAKNPRDLNQLAAAIVGAAVEETPPAAESPPVDPVKAAAALLGRKGGLRGGPARAKSLSKKRRSEIARKAARKRWTKP